MIKKEQQSSVETDGHYHQETTFDSKEEMYNETFLQLQSILDETLPLISNLSNVSSLLYNNMLGLGMPVNWVGFYLALDEDWFKVTRHRFESEGLLYQVSSQQKHDKSTNGHDDIANNNKNQSSQNEKMLYLGPFQGKIACTKIPFSKGVCGFAASEKRTIVVGNVHEFPGHIPCDGASLSEIVVPMMIKIGDDDAACNDKSVVLGVLDIDASRLNVFNENEDFAGLEKIVNLIMNKLC